MVNATIAGLISVAPAAAPPGAADAPAPVPAAATASRDATATTPPDDDSSRTVAVTDNRPIVRHSPAATGGTLPVTGHRPAELVALAALLVLAGVATRLVARRTRRAARRTRMAARRGPG